MADDWEPTPPLAVSASFKESGRIPSRRRATMRPSFDADNEFMTLLHGSDPVKVELNRLENEVRDKDRELGESQAEIKALRLSERQREKAVEELTDELSKMEEKLKLQEKLLEGKNLEIKKINDEKKASMAAQFAAEATLRRVHALLEMAYANRRAEKQPAVDTRESTGSSDLPPPTATMTTPQSCSKVLNRRRKSSDIRCDFIIGDALDMIRDYTNSLSPSATGTTKRRKSVSSSYKSESQACMDLAKKMRVHLTTDEYMDLMLLLKDDWYRMVFMKGMLDDIKLLKLWISKAKEN